MDKERMGRDAGSLNPAPAAIHVPERLANSSKSIRSFDRPEARLLGISASRPMK
jgi:hypothetical protein